LDRPSLVFERAPGPASSASISARVAPSSSPQASIRTARSAWVYSLGTSPYYADPGRRSLEIVFERERAAEVEARDASGD